MTPKQERFVQEYLIDLNATQAAIRAGYSKKRADAIGYDILRKPEIQAAIQEGQKRIAHNLGVTAERIVTEYARIAFADMGALADWNARGMTIRPSNEIVPDQTAAIQEVVLTPAKDGGISIRIKLHDKIRALDSLARHLGMFEDKVNVTVPSLAERLRQAQERVEKAEMLDGKT